MSQAATPDQEKRAGQVRLMITIGLARGGAFVPGTHERLAPMEAVSGPSPKGIALFFLAVVVAAAFGLWLTQRPGDAEPAQWQVDPAASLTAASREVPISVIERECASGRSASGRIEVKVDESVESITFDVRVKRRPGAQDCQGNPITPYVVELGSPLGERVILGATPAGEWSGPATTETTEPPSSSAVGALDFHLDSDPLRNPAVFGYSALTEVDDAALVADVSEALGDPDDDTGWIPMPDEYACTGATEYRSLLWADIRFVLARPDGPATTYVAAWSIGDTALLHSPALAVEITEPSGITTADGIGLGTSADRLEDVDWAQFMRQDDRFSGLAGTGPVTFQLDAADRVVAMSYEQNDC
jgi:hypothetical protein